MSACVVAHGSVPRPSASMLRAAGRHRGTGSALWGAAQRVVCKKNQGCSPPAAKRRKPQLHHAFVAVAKVARNAPTLA